MFRNRSGQFLVLSLLVIGASGCKIFLGDRPLSTKTADATQVDRSLFSLAPCQAPCWYGLRLGESTKDDVRAALQTLSFLDQSTIQETAVGYWDSAEQRNIPAKLISAGCLYPEGQQCVGLTLADGTLKIVGIFPNYELTFRDVVEHLGEPDYVSAHLVPPVNTPGCLVRLIWVERQIIIDHIKGTSTELCTSVRSGSSIKPDLRVDAVTYVLPDDIQLQSIPDPDTDFPWPGFSLR